MKADKNSTWNKEDPERGSGEGRQLETAVGNKRPITISLSLSLSPWDNSCWRDNCVGERSFGAEYKVRVDAATGRRNGVAGGRGSVSGRRLCSFTITVERGI